MLEEWYISFFPYAKGIGLLYSMFLHILRGFWFASFVFTPSAFENHISFCINGLPHLLQMWILLIVNVQLCLSFSCD